jgi:hypothetical protein
MMEHEMGLSIWSQLAREYLTCIPFFVVWLVGIVLAFVFLRRHPAASVLMIFGFLLLFAEALAGPYFLYLLIWRVDMMEDPRRLEWVFTLIAYVRSGVKAVAWILFLVALFNWRSGGAYQWYD